MGDNDLGENNNKKTWNWRTGYFGSRKKSNGQTVNVNVKKSGGIFGSLVFLVLCIWLAPRIGASFELERVFNTKPPVNDYNRSTVMTNLDYRKALLEDYTEMTLFKLQGEVEQMIDDDTIIVNIEKKSTKNIQASNFPTISWTNEKEAAVYVDFENEPKILEGDTVELRMRYFGTGNVRNMSGFGEKIEIPKFLGDYYKVVKEK